MTREEFITLLEEELEEIDNALFDETERDKEVNGFYEAYTEPSAAAVSNTLQVVSNNDVKEKGTNLMITAIQESNGYSQFYIVSLVNKGCLSIRVYLMCYNIMAIYAFETTINVSLPFS